MPEAPTHCGVWGRESLGSLSLAFMQRGDYIPGPLGHKRRYSTTAPGPSFNIVPLMHKLLFLNLENTYKSAFDQQSTDNHVSRPPEKNVIFTHACILY